jgi:hypothetical protein
MGRHGLLKKDCQAVSTQLLLACEFESRRPHSKHRTNNHHPAGVAELEYAPDLGSGGRKPVGVRVPPPA